MACDGADDESDGADSEVDCWQHYDEDSCLAEAETCHFEPGAGYQIVDGVCEPRPDLGWCPEGGFGGSAVGSVWYEETTGRVLSLGLNATSGPPGWKKCGGGLGVPLCEDDPTLTPQCRLCVCP